MNNIKKYILGALVAAAACGASAQSVRNVTAFVPDTALIMPESFETDTKAMLEEWYLKNYAVLDYEADSQPQTELSDDIIIERLGALPTEIEMPLNGPVRNAINFYANRKRQLVENMLGLSLYYMPIFEEALERHKMPCELKYLPVIESALIPHAVSRAGAAGLWQFMPGTATGIGLEINSLVDQRRDPYLSSDAAARYLKQLYKTYGDWSLAIAAYNCGPGNVNKALRRAGEGKHDFWDIYPFLPSETRGYVPAFIAANYIMNYHKHHNISPALARKPIITDSVHVKRRVHFEQISDVLGIPLDEIRALNPQFRKDVIPGDIRPYSLVLPSLQTLAYVANEDSIVNHNASRYARRGYVEPASGATQGRDAKGEYYDEEIVKYHKVKRGETLSSIARKYGVSVAQIRKYNKVGKSVKQGRNLKIVTVQRRYKPVAPPAEPVNTTPQQPETTNQQPDNAVNASQPDSISPAQETTTTPVVAETDSVATVEPETAAGEVSAAFTASAAQQQNQAQAQQQTQTQTNNETKARNSAQTSAQKNKKAAAKPKTTTHTVRRGENLGKIAKRYGVTIAAIKRANNMAGDKIQVGQKLKIPVK